MAIIIDQMEYASDAEAQAEYVFNGGAIDVGANAIDRSNTGTAGYTYIAKDNPANLSGKITNIEVWFKTNATGVKVGSFYGSGTSYTLRSSANIGSVTAGSKQSFSVDIDIVAGDLIGWYMDTGGMAFSTTGGSGLLYILNDQFSAGTQTYTLQSGYSFSLYGYNPSISLSVSSESTIKEYGTYSLKGVATQTSSLNKTLTRTLSTPIDLSGESNFKGSIRSSRTGSNIKIGLHDSGGTTTEITPNITSADTWQLFDLDISGVSSSNKDAIDQIIIAIVNADDDNTFYLDEFLAENLSDTTGSGDIIVPVPLIDGYGGFNTFGSGNIFIHAPTISGSESILDTTGTGVVLVPSPIIEAISEWTTGIGNIMVPAPEINGESYGTFGVGNILVPAPVINGESYSTVGWGVISIPAPNISASGSDGTSGSGDIKVPTPIILGYELVGDTTGSGVILVPAPIIQGSELYDALVCLVMGLDSGMPLSEYTNYDFVGFARLGSMYLALSKDGNIYRLGGDTDITESVDSVIETGQDDLGVSTSKRLMGLVAGLKSDGLMQYRAHRWNEYGEYIEIETTESDVIETRKIPTEKVPLSRTIGLEFSNVDGADFSIDSIEMDIRLSPRRSGGS